MIRLRELPRFRTVLIVGAAIRIAIAPFFAHVVDVFHWYEIGTSFFQGTIPLSNFFTPYQYSFFLFLFPGTLLFDIVSKLVPSGVIQMSSLNPALNPGPQWSVTLVPGLLFNLAFKLPLILSDLLIGLLLYRTLLKISKDERAATSGAALWILNPLSIWISSGWGMFDTLPALFTILTLYMLLEGRIGVASLSLVLAIAMKYYAVVLVFPFLLFVWRTRGRREMVKAATVSALASAALFLPAALATSSNFLALAGSGPSPVARFYPGLSFWTAISLFLPNINKTILSTAVFGAALLVSYWLLWRAPRNSGFLGLTLSFALPIASLLFAYRFVAENFFIWILPMAALLCVGDSRGQKIYWSLSIVALLSSVTDSLLPYYMLPMAPWIGGFLVGLLALANPYRTGTTGPAVTGLTIGKAYLAAIGLLAGALLVLMVRQWLSGSRGQILDPAGGSEAVTSSIAPRSTCLPVSASLSSDDTQGV